MLLIIFLFSVSFANRTSAACTQRATVLAQAEVPQWI